MRDYRRIARELALRVLYEVDVGRQPAREALQGALDQIAGGVRAGITMAVREAEAAMKREPGGPAVFTPRSVSVERRRVARAVTRALERIAIAFEPTLAELFSLSAATDALRHGAGQARLALSEASAGPLARLRRTLDSSMLDLPEREHAWRVAQRAVERMATTLDRRSETSLKTAHMLSSLVRGALRFRDEIDEQVRPLVSDWPTERQSAVDRNVLRLAAFEILHREDTPVPVALNEAVELAKRYGTEESGRFVNGVLSALVARDAKHKAEEPSD